MPWACSLSDAAQLGASQHLRGCKIIYILSLSCVSSRKWYFKQVYGVWVPFVLGSSGTLAPTPCTTGYQQNSLKPTPKLLLNQVWQETNMAPDISIFGAASPQQSGAAPASFVAMEVAQHHYSYSHFTQKDKKMRFFSIKTIIQYKPYPLVLHLKEKYQS